MRRRQAVPRTSAERGRQAGPRTSAGRRPRATRGTATRAPRRAAQETIPGWWRWRWRSCASTSPSVRTSRRGLSDSVSTAWPAPTCGGRSRFAGVSQYADLVVAAGGRSVADGVEITVLAHVLQLRSGAYRDGGHWRSSCRWSSGRKGSGHGPAASTSLPIGSGLSRSRPGTAPANLSPTAGRLARQAVVAFVNGDRATLPAWEVAGRQRPAPSQRLAPDEHRHRRGGGSPRRARGHLGGRFARSGRGDGPGPYPAADGSCQLPHAGGRPARHQPSWAHRSPGRGWRVAMSPANLGPEPNRPRSDLGPGIRAKLSGRGCDDLHWSTGPGSTAGHHHDATPDPGRPDPERPDPGRPGDLVGPGDPAATAAGGLGDPSRGAAAMAGVTRPGAARPRGSGRLGATRAQLPGQGRHALRGNVPAGTPTRSLDRRRYPHGRPRSRSRSSDQRIPTAKQRPTGPARGLWDGSEGRRRRRGLPVGPGGWRRSPRRRWRSRRQWGSDPSPESTR